MTSEEFGVALVLAYGVVLLISVSLSGLAARTVLSTALLFLVAGALLGPGGFGIVTQSAEDEIVAVLADIALFTVLFTDGQRASVPALREGWRLSGRALGLGMPLAMIGIAIPAHYLANLDWPTSFLLGRFCLPPTRCSPRRWSDAATSRYACAGCSMWSPGSTTVSPCRSC